MAVGDWLESRVVKYVVLKAIFEQPPIFSISGRRNPAVSPTIDVDLPRSLESIATKESSTA